MDDKRYWIGFTLVKGIGAVRFQRLLDHFGDAQSAWGAAPIDLARAGLSAKLIERLVAVREKADLSLIWDQIQSKGIRVLTWLDGSYPQRLKEIEQPPPVLYLRGELSTDDEWAVAVVGSRRVTPYGRQVAEEISSGKWYHRGQRPGTWCGYHCAQDGAQSRRAYIGRVGFGSRPYLPA